MGKLSKTEYLGLSIIILINLLLKIPLNAQGFFAFTYDQGRDLLKVAQIVFEHNLTLIGPTTGLQGAFYGPWWYYFLSPILYFSNGNPQGVANFFGFLAVLTIITLFLLIKRISGSFILAFSLSLIASISKSWMFAPTLIWSTSMTPILLISFFYVIHRIINNRHPSIKTFFIMGITATLIMDSELPFGLMLSIFVLISIFLFKKNFYKKEFLSTLLGMILILSPRIFFDVKHNFLMTKSIILYLTHPKFSADQAPILQRIWYRLDLYWGIFSSAFARDNKLFGLILLITITIIIFIMSHNKKAWASIKNDSILKYSSLMLTFSLIFFTLHKDVVWDYYLIGLPTVFIITLSQIFSHALKVEKIKTFTIFLLSMLVLLNFNKDLLSPFKTNWLGEGSTYKNEKMVMDNIASQNPHDYSFYAYSPAIFDYPFDYLFFWYSKKGLIEQPHLEQKNMFLIIRESSSKKYLSSGWYGDKTNDNTRVVYKRSFPGDLLLEQHSQIK